MIPFQSYIVTALVGVVIGTAGTAWFLDNQRHQASTKVTIASQQVQAQAQTEVLQKTEKSNTITVDNTAKLTKELLDAKDEVSRLRRGIDNGSLGMRVNVLASSCKNPAVPDAGNTQSLPQTVTAELDAETANQLVDIAAQGDDNARYYNAFRAWYEEQLKNQRETK